MIKTFVILLVLIALINIESFGQKNHKQEFKILTLGETPLFMDTDTLRDASLNEKDISRLDELTDKCIQKWNEKIPVKYIDGYRGDRKSEEYFIQYLAAYNKSGEKIVWVNFLRKKDVKELPDKLVIITDSQFYYNCWINLNQSKIIN